MISLNKLNNPNNFNVNVKPNVNVNVSTIKNDIPSLLPDAKEIIKNDPNISEYVKSIDSDSVSVHYPSSVIDLDEYNKLKNKVEVLKIIIHILKNNPLLYNGYIVADDIKLMKLIQLLTNADDIQIEAEDIGEGCLSKKLYRKVHTIYVIKNNKTENLKYNYPDIMKELTDLGISLKFVF